MRLATLNLPDLNYVIAHIRDTDRCEISAVRWDDNLEHLAEDCMALGRFSWIAGGDKPIAAFGCAPLWPGCWTGWMFATDELDKIGFSLTKFIKRTILPALSSTGVHRIEARSMRGHRKAQQWLERLGANPEGLVSQCGKNKEDFIQYSLILEPTVNSTRS